MRDKTDWNNWKWQLAHSIRSIDELKQYISLSDREILSLRSSAHMAFSITPYLAEKLKESEENSALRKQFIPSVDSNNNITYKNDDFLEEHHFEPVNNLIHKYNDRLAILATNHCAAYCRHCTRSRLVGKATQKPNWNDIIKYIQDNAQITDVLLTGGDPLILSDNTLYQLLEQINSITHVRVIRIGTRIPVSLPMRITNELVLKLKRFKSLYINLHINHPDELTEETKNAIMLLADAGIPLGSQSVLLKGINDKSEILEQLFKELLYIRVKPYYLYQCDKVKGCEQFWVSPLKGIQLINSLSGKISGMAIPKYVIDMPGKYGKQIIAPCNAINISQNEIKLKNYQNEIKIIEC